jgi:hypothetical protein
MVFGQQLAFEPVPFHDVLCVGHGSSERNPFFDLSGEFFRVGRGATGAPPGNQQNTYNEEWKFREAHHDRARLRPARSV